MGFEGIYFLIAMAYWINFSSARENGRLFYYETMSKILETTRAKRSSPPSPRLVKELHFQAFRRDFHLSLTSGSSVLAEGFQARMIHGDGSSTRFTVDQSKLFTGRVVHSKQSMVSAFLEGELWNIHIFEQGEAFAVEPSWRLLARVDNPHNDTMVTYRLSDVKDLPHSYRFCGVPSDLNNTDRSKSPEGKKQSGVRSEYVNGQRSRPSRHKRNARNTCLIHLVGDASLLEKGCRRDPNYCASVMIHFSQVTDDLFRGSKFEDREGNFKTGYGLQVSALHLYSEYTTQQDPHLGRHFNDGGNYTTTQKAVAFARYMYKTQLKFCVHHLMSAYKDPRGSQGGAYTGGLCGFPNSHKLAANTGVSSMTTSVGILLPGLVASLVISHEISHNFGSPHDANTPECAPADKDGGKYLMWPFTVRGNRPNNKLLSKCSLRHIGRKVPAWCFVERTQFRQSCGNAFVEGDEECDVGTYDKDKCCTSDCKLRDGANCSDSNHECCKNCRIAPKGTQCWKSGYSYSCKRDSYCTGNNLECPEGKIQPDGESCGVLHVCSGGECIGPCQQQTKRMKNGTIYKACSCSRNSAELCMFCCFDATRATEPGECWRVSLQVKPTGSQCLGGICHEGTCDQTPVYSAAILQNYIRRSTQMNSFSKFLKNNIVFVVVLLTLILWVPPSLIISHFDKKESEGRDVLLEQEMEDLRMQHGSNVEIVSHTRLVEQEHVASSSRSVLDHGHDHRTGHSTSSAESDW